MWHQHFLMAAWSWVDTDGFFCFGWTSPLMPNVHFSADHVPWWCQTSSWSVRSCWWLRASSTLGCSLGSLSPSTLCVKSCYPNRCYMLSSNLLWLKESQTVSTSKLNNWPNVHFLFEAFDKRMTLRHHSGADLTVWVKPYMHMNEKLQGVRMLFHPSFFINPFFSPVLHVMPLF